MQARHFLSAAFGALALGLAATSAQAAPAAGMVATLQADVADAAQVEKVTYGYRYGYRDYGWRPYRGYGYRYWRPYKYYRHYGDYGYYDHHHYGWGHRHWRHHRHWY